MGRRCPCYTSDSMDSDDFSKDAMSRLCVGVGLVVCVGLCRCVVVCRASTLMNRYYNCTGQDERRKKKEDLLLIPSLLYVGVSSPVELKRGGRQLASPCESTRTAFYLLSPVVRPRSGGTLVDDGCWAEFDRSWLLCGT